MDLPRQVHADPRRIKQILKNLLSNAIKFTPHGGSVKLLIHKEAWRVGKEFSSESLVFQVVDTGCGIPAHQQESVFQLFRQGDGSSSRKYRGTGLGLAMSRKLARLLEGLGLRVHLAESGPAALALLEKNPGIDLILLDLMMPTMDGCQVLEILRSRIEFRMLPVIMLTASMLKEDEIRCRAAGADDYLCKPIEISLLVDRLATFLSRAP